MVELIGKRNLGMADSFYEGPVGSGLLHYSHGDLLLVAIAGPLHMAEAET